MKRVAAWMAAWLVLTGMGARIRAVTAPNTPPRIETLRPIIERELPRGSTVAQVLAFLKIWGVEHTGLVEPEEAIYAELAHTPDTLLTTERVQLQFWFHNGLLVEVNVRELFRS